MTTDQAQSKQQSSTTTPNAPATGAAADMTVHITAPTRKTDFATILGIIFSLGLIAGAIAMGSGNANFFNVPSLLIVFFGTITATSIAYTADEMRRALKIIGQSVVRKSWNPQIMARQLLDIAVLARKKGLLSIGGATGEIARDKVLARAVELVTDGYSGEDIERILSQEIDSLVERHRRSAGILRRGGEIAPAMGLIGTLVGLVQMLADLDDPAAIGPAMAMALLTTFYGAILGMVILNPLAAKLERNSNDEAMIRTMIMIAMTSIARQENPRRLEMLLNSELPPGSRIRYFD
jgi:chemotaxis protein MotA